MKKVVGLVLVAVALLLIAIPAIAVVTEPTPTPTPNSSIRIYGECGVNAPDSWRFWWEPYDPNAIPKDSWTTNPAYIHTDKGVVVNNGDAREKVYLRAWYEPCSVFGGPNKNNTLQAIVMEYTYLLMTTTYQPAHGRDWYHSHVDTKIYFPVAEKEGQLGLGKVESGNAAWKNIRVAQIDPNSPDSDNQPDAANRSKTMWGQIWLEKWYQPSALEDDFVQFFDHKVKVVGYYSQYDHNASKWRRYPVIEICYAGNVDDDECRTNIVLQPNVIYWFDRHNQFTTTPIARGGDPRPLPPPPYTASWYISYENDTWMIKLGKFLSADPNTNITGAKVFYVNGVRYEVAAIELVNTTRPVPSQNVTYDAFKSITIRAKLPKGYGDYPDESWVSSQWVRAIKPGEVLPVLPPFNEVHNMVDDINVPCNNVAEEQNRTNPNICGLYGGTMRLTLKSGEEVKITCIDTDGDGINICYDVDERIINDVEPFKAMYIDENIEMRYSTNLLEKLNETRSCPPIFNPHSYYECSYCELIENWTKFDIQSLPDLYTEFVLPPLPDVQVAADMGMYGDYIIETNFTGDQVTKTLLVNNTTVVTHRVVFTYDPDHTTEDIYVNYNSANNVNTIRIYGNDSQTTLGTTWYYDDETRDAGPWYAPTVYPDDEWQWPFNPASVIKDSITFDPTIIQYSKEFPMSANGIDADEKQYVRIMYAPRYDFFGEHYTHDQEPAIVIEYIYMLIDRQDKKPLHGGNNTTWIAIPFVSKVPFNGLDAFENEGILTDKKNVVLVSGVWANAPPEPPLYKTTNGTVVLEKHYTVKPGDVVWFFDHAFRYDGIDENDFANFTVWYTGNAQPMEDDNWGRNGTKITIDTRTQNGRNWYFDRHNNYFNAPLHPQRTTFLRIDNVLTDGSLMITVGKEISKGDIFYVDGVRYEVPAVCVVQINEHEHYEFKYIVLRTPIPKWENVSEGTCPNADNVDCENKVGCKPDWGPITSQWILKWGPCCPLPILPPASWDDREIVDDTDVPLWKPLKHLDKWPYGDPNGVPGVEYFPEGERYITMQYPPVTWLIFFHAVPIDIDHDMSPEMPTDYQRWNGPYYPDTISQDLNISGDIKWIIKVPEPRRSGGFYYDDVIVEYNLSTGTWNVTAVVVNETMTIVDSKLIASGTDQYRTFDSQAWIANDVDERIISAPALDICWKSNGKEYRFSTNLLEVLREWSGDNQTVNETWTVLWTYNKADRYVELKLPSIPSVNHIVYVGQKEFVQDYRKYPGSFIITTAWNASNGLGDLNINHTYAYLTNNNSNITKVGPDPRFAFTWNVKDGFGIYVNENPHIPIPVEKCYIVRLDKGDNYVSLPVEPATTDPKAIFGPDTEVWTFNATSKKWEMVTSVEAGKGYYVYSPRPKTVRVCGTPVTITASDILETLTDGWNLVGVGNKSIKVEDLNGVLVMKWEPWLKMFVPMPPREELEPTKAYWIYK